MPLYAAVQRDQRLQPPHALQARGKGVPVRAVIAAEARAREALDLMEECRGLVLDADQRAFQAMASLSLAHHQLMGARQEADAMRARAVVAEMTVLQQQARLKEAEAAAERREAEVDSLTRCAVCLDRRRSVLARPCMHLALCNTCVTMLPRDAVPGQRKKVRRCPICRQSVASFLKDVILS